MIRIVVMYLPLICFIVPLVICTIIMIPREISIIVGFSLFILGFGYTYMSMVREVGKNRDAVLKIGNKTPVVVPYMFFALSTIVTTLIFIPKSADMIVQFASCFIMTGVVYGAGAVITIAVLKHDAMKSASRKVKPSGKTKKIILINPVNSCRTGLTVNSSSKFPPLGLGIIAALTPDDYDMILIDENMEPFHYEDGDIVGITAFTSAANRAYEIAAIYRKNGIPVVMGGIHASMLSDEALEYVDTVVIGEAESVWGELISDFENGTLKKKYQGDATDLVSAPEPRREIFSDRYLFATVQTSRGCPMDCSFCSVTPFNGNKFRQRPVSDVLEELKKIPQQYIFFVDDNILGYGKEAGRRAIELFRGMAELKMNKYWFCQSSLNFGENDEVLYWAQKSGCKMVFIGLESADPEELKSMNKKLNLKIEYDSAFKKIHKYGIAVLGAFIFGSDCETVESMIRKTDYSMRGGIDVVQTTVLTPLPGTRLYTQYKDEGRLKYADYPGDWDKYDMSEMVFIPRMIEEHDFKNCLDQCCKRICSMSAVSLRFLRTLCATRSFTAAFFAFGSNMAYRSVNRC